MPNPSIYLDTTAAGCKQIFFSLYHQKDEIHSFPAMYNTWGSSWGRNTRNTLEGLLDFVLRALRALRPCDPRRCVHDACISDSDCCIHKPLSLSEKVGCRLH